jgi:predicted ATP-dependent protease
LSSREVVSKEKEKPSETDPINQTALHEFQGETADAGVKRVILPVENEPDVANLPDYMRNRLDVVYASDIQQVLAVALVK